VAPGIRVRLPRALLEYWDGPPQLDVHGATLAEALGNLEARVPGLAGRLHDDQGNLRQHVAVFVNGNMVEGRDPAAVRLKPGDEVRIVPAVSGG